ncbi:MAG: carboxypeptidase regulatory-like domain-containing protein [Planctomycetes bacterium]|nr:carboxypeptidase regulatory-like domain-containing protein [Planctomycetota bacterium]
MLFVRLARGATVSGKVLDAQGHALKDAKVSVSGFTGPLSHAVRGTEATTDGDGCYRLDGLPAGSISLRCSSKGFKAEHASDIPVQSGGEVANVDFVLQAAQPSRK